MLYILPYLSQCLYWLRFLFYTFQHTMYCCVKQKSPFVISLVFADTPLLQNNTVKLLHSLGNLLNFPGSQEALETDYLDFRNVFLRGASISSVLLQPFWHFGRDQNGKCPQRYVSTCISCSSRSWKWLPMILLIL